MLGVSGGFATGIVGGVVYGALALVYLIPSVFLSRYASDIARLRSSLRVQDLEEALQSQKSFWKFIGIATIVMIVLYVLLLAVVFTSSVDIFSSPGGPVRIRKTF